MNDSVCGLIEACDDELKDIAGKIEKASSFDKTIFYLTQYALIKASGTIEFAVKCIVADYCDLSTTSQVQNYIDTTIRNSSMSSKYQNMMSLLKKFDANWGTSFKDKVNAMEDAQKVIQSADSLVNNRHCFAHGKNTTASFADILQYYNDAKRLLSLLDEVVNGLDA